MYFDEEVVLDLRLNTLNEFVDYFVVVESIFTHKALYGYILKYYNRFLTLLKSFYSSSV